MTMWYTIRVMRTNFRNPAKRHEKNAEIEKSDREHAALLAALNSQVDTALFCQNCNAKLKRDAARCHYCGSADLAIRPIGLPLFSQAAINGACPRCYGTSFSTSSGMLAGGVLYVIGMFVCTLAFNVPLNDALAAVDPASVEGASVWARYLADWTLWNHVRTVSSTLACALFIWAITVR